MEEIEKIQNIIDCVNQRVTKNYQSMKIEDISRELRESMKFEQEIFNKIDELETQGISSELIKYAKMICKNTTEREISEIQEIYLLKIDEKFLKN